MIFGYARVSTDDQNLSLQIDALTHYGIDKLFQEKVTGAKKDRPQLEEMINLLRECLWQDKRTYNCSPKVHNSASSLG